MRKRLAITATLVALVTMAAASCTTTTKGDPAASAGSTRTTDAPTSGASGATNPPGADPLATVDPCSLLSPETVSKNGLTQGQPEPEPDARTCSWDKKADANSAGYGVSIGIYDHVGLNQINTSDVTISNHPLGHHQGRLVKFNALGTCHVALGVTGTSRVDVLGISGRGDIDEACAVAISVAPSVESKLPVAGG